VEFYKTINPGTDYTINPFKSYANQQYVIVSGSLTNPEEVTLNRAEQYPSNWSALGDVGPINSPSQIPSYTLFASIQHLYYSSHSLDRIPYSTTDLTSVTEFYPSQSVFVLNVAQYAYGEQILPESFRIDIDGSTFDIVDRKTSVDGLGVLYASSSANVLGNIFYKEGVVVLKEDTTSVVSGVSPTLGARIQDATTVTVTFQSQMTIYQHRIVCRVAGNELNRSVINPSSRLTYAMSGSVPNAGGSVQNLFKSGSLVPYQTSIGLYNAQNDLVAIAKLSTPIKRTKVTDQVFIIQFDSIM